MNIISVLFLFFSASVMSILVYYLFKKYIIKMEGPAMKFLGINIIKDILWVAFWIFNLENTTTNFLAVIAVFLITSIYLYYKVIRLLNNS